MYINSGVNSQRYRAIGGGEMVKAVNGTTTVPTPQTDRMSYSFYGLGNLFITGSHLKYLTLQGVDPLYANYDTNGLFGTCSGDINTANFQCTTTLPSLVNCNCRMSPTGTSYATCKELITVLVSTGLALARPFRRLKRI